MRFQYVSDIHLEHLAKIPKITRDPSASVLILAGDIGNPRKALYKIFLEHVCKLGFEYVLLIAGNHEYYSMSLQEGDRLIREIVASISCSLIYLQNEVFHLSDDIAVYGATFWSHIPIEDRIDVILAINDYSYINDFTVQQCNDEHRISVETLTNAIAQCTNDKKWIVISHHMPKKQLIHTKFAGLPYNSAFASDIDIADDPRIVAWVYGHTHYPSVSGKFYANPIGYKGENLSPTYTKTFDVLE
jgi:predicted phosphodiesterase